MNDNKESMAAFYCVVILVVLSVNAFTISRLASRQHSELASMLNQCNITLTDEENKDE